MASRSPGATSPTTGKKAAKEPRAQLVVKTSDGEVRFEAGLEAVEKRFDRLMDRLFAGRPGAGTPSPTVTPIVAMRSVPAQTRSPAPAPAPALANYPSLSLDLVVVAECYAVNAAEELSLRAIPRGLKQRERDADTLLLLLYGKLALQGRSPITAPALLRGARQSGLKLDRASRLLGHRRAYVHTAGRRRGMKYHLTAAGIQYCETLLRKLHASLSPAASAASSTPPRGS